MATTRHLLTTAQAQVNDVDKDGHTALHFASEEGHLTVAQLLVDEFGADVHVASDDMAVQLLHFAAQNGHLDIMQWRVTCDMTFGRCGSFN